MQFPGKAIGLVYTSPYPDSNTLSENDFYRQLFQSMNQYVLQRPFLGVYGFFSDYSPYSVIPKFMTLMDKEMSAFNAPRIGFDVSAVDKMLKADTNKANYFYISRPEWAFRPQSFRFLSSILNSNKVELIASPNIERLVSSLWKKPKFVVPVTDLGHIIDMIVEEEFPTDGETIHNPDGSIDKIWGPDVKSN